MGRSDVRTRRHFFRQISGGVLAAMHFCNQRHGSGGRRSVGPRRAVYLAMVSGRDPCHGPGGIARGPVKTSRAPRSSCATVRRYRPGGAAVFETDTLRTGADGTVGITLKDDTRVSLGPGERCGSNVTLRAGQGGSRWLKFAREWPRTCRAAWRSSLPTPSALKPRPPLSA